MFSNYVKIAMRNILKHKTYSTINIFGLAIGMASCILLLSYIFTELSYDRFHSNYERIYRLGIDGIFGGRAVKGPGSNSASAGILIKDYREVENAVRIKTVLRSAITYGVTRFYEDKIIYADRSFFEVFTFPMISGNPRTALEARNSVVITKSIALKYFGLDEPVGKILSLNNDRDFAVTGVIEDMPSNSHLDFDFILSMETIDDRDISDLQKFLAFEYSTFVLLQDDYLYNDLEEKLPDMVQTYMGELLGASGSTLDIFLQPLKNIHLNIGEQLDSESGIYVIYIFGAIAVFILLIAAINFMNLSMASSGVRLKEISMRKVLGADRGALVRQFLGESLLFSFFSLILSLLIVELSLPILTELSGSEALLNYFEMPWLIPAFICLAFIVGIVSGLYPAFVLSSFKPVRILKSGSAGIKGTSVFRKSLVVIQFSISIALIIGTVIIFRQLHYMKDKPLGFDKDYVVILPSPETNTGISLNSIREELEGFSGITSAGLSSSVPGQAQPLIGMFPEGFNFDQPQIAQLMSVDHNFIPTLGIELVDGRNFIEESGTDNTQSVIINETAVKVFNWDDPLDKRIQFFDMATSSMTSKTVIGVVADFHTTSLHTTIEPQIIDNDPVPLRSLAVRIRPENIALTLNFLRDKWTEFSPGKPFDYFFLDESIDVQYASEERLSKILSYFSFIAIFIALLGLFAMSSIAIKQRIKEIGIRKVLGASISSVVLLFSKEIFIQIIAANVIAWPLAYYFMNSWLESFAYKTELGWKVFIASGVSALVIALFTVGYQALKAGLANPTDALRYE